MTGQGNKKSQRKPKQEQRQKQQQKRPKQQQKNRKPSIWDAYDISKWGKKEWLRWAATVVVFMVLFYACGFDKYFE